MYDASSQRFEHLSQKAAFRAILDTSDRRLFRIDLEPIVTRWKNGAAPFTEATKTFAYDGKQWIYAIGREGPEGDAFETNQVRISHREPRNLSSIGYEGGMVFLLPFVKVFDKVPISTALADPAKFNMKSEWVVENGQQMIRLEFSDFAGNPNTRDTLWIAPALGPMMVRRLSEFSLRSAKGRFSNQYVVSKWREVENGIYLPEAASFVRSFADVPRSRHDIVWTQNEIISSLPPREYEFLITPGWRVEE